MIPITVKKATYREAEVFFYEFYDFGVSRLGVNNLPGRLVEADSCCFIAKPFAGVVPVDSLQVGGVSPLPLALVLFLYLSLRTFCRPMWSGGGSRLGG